MAVFAICFLAALVRPTRRHLQTRRELFHLPQLLLIAAGHCVNGIVQLLNVFGLLGKRHLAIFVCGLLWLLFHSIFQFGRILFVQPPAKAEATCDL